MPAGRSGGGSLSLGGSPTASAKGRAFGKIGTARRTPAGARVDAGRGHWCLGLDGGSATAAERPTLAKLRAA
jgi:hypothetical protein